MHNTQDKHVPVFNTVNDDIFAHDRAAASGTEILIAGTSDVGEAGKDKKSVCDGVDYPFLKMDPERLDLPIK